MRAEEAMRKYDLVVIGAGLAGLTAAMYGARHGLRTAVVDQMGAGGQIINAERVEDFPGFPDGIAGYDLGPLVQEQAEAAGAEFVLDTATGLRLDGAWRIVTCDAEDELQARAVIIACGSSFRRLGIPGEEELTGRGVSTCATCDGPFFIDQPVCVIGGGDSALDEALVLTQFASYVTVFHRGDELDGQDVFRKRVAESPKIEVVRNVTVEAILGDEAVTGVRVQTGRSISESAVLGVFVYVGLEPNTAFLRDVLELDPAGHIVTDLMMQTSVPGVFAAGDLRQHSVRQLVSAAGDGATAAVAAYRYVKSFSGLKH
jgi:thioredoxin reductase (NADPH)